MRHWIPLLLSLGCTPGGSEPTTDENTSETSDPTGNTGASTLEEIPDDDPLSAYFAKQISVFGIPIVATSSTPDAKVLHAAGVMFQYLDNDADGAADHPDVVDAMIANQAILVMFATESEIEQSGIFDDPLLWNYWGQDLYASETRPANGFDASLEEVLHLIQTAGYASVWPDDIGFEGTTTLTEAMDLARGGHFEDVPQQYPPSAWYHYDDRTCDYECMAVEYFYWGLTTLLGAQVDRCAEIDWEWELCTPEQFESGDPALHALLTDPSFGLPKTLPDGNYQPQ